MESTLPKLVVFDLDYTLWPFWVDTHVEPPFTKKTNGKVYDSSGRPVNFYPEVTDVLRTLDERGIQMAVASRTTSLEDANNLIELFGWSKYFVRKEIYPGSKTRHFQSLNSKLGIEYRDMLFFDDEYRNIVDVSELGVTCILVENGMTLDQLQIGLEQRSTK